MRDTEHIQIRNEKKHKRIVLARLISFTCVACGQHVTQERFPAPTPLYCSEYCRGESRREYQRELMKARRAAKGSSGKRGRPKKS